MLHLLRITRLSMPSYADRSSDLRRGCMGFWHLERDPLLKDLLKSQGELLLDLFLQILADLCGKYPEQSKTFHRDIIEIEHRYSMEGLSFLTKTLPKLGKAFDAALESQRLSIPCEFKRYHKNRNIPAFLRGLFSLCFDAEGSLGDPSPSVIADIRQILFLAYKVEVPYSPALEESVIEGFIQTEVELENMSLDSHTEVIRMARELIHHVCSDLDLKDIRPKHGPGAVATGERMDEKWNFSRLYSRIHQMYPYYDYFMIGEGRELVDRIKWYRSLDRLDTGTAKVVLVPKDSRGPRLISCEPLEYQFIQQGINRALVARLESHSLTKGQINFASQEINRSLALANSMSREMATIDLKDASDRLSRELVKILFPTRIFNCLDAARSSATRLPDGRVIELNKFAPMGSAICFSIEAFVFWALSVASIVIQSGCSYGKAAHRVFVYGDDIIIPITFVPGVVATLEAYGLKVNMHKSFRYGYFRESCGMDAYKGVEVTPTRISTLWTGDRKSVV